MTPPIHHHEFQLQRRLALAMVVLEAVAIGYLSHTIVLPAFALLVAVAGVLTRFRVEMTRQKTYDMIALTAIACVIKYMVSPDNPRYVALFPSQQIAFATAEYVLVLQVLQFFISHRDDRLPFIFPGIGVVALVCAAMVEVNDRQRAVFQSMCIGFALLAAAYCDASRRFALLRPGHRFGRPVATGIVLLIVGATGWGTATALYRFERQMDELVQRWLMNEPGEQRIGFRETSELGAVTLRKQQQDESIALRITSESAPTYMRGRAFSVFETNRWLMIARGDAVQGQSERPEQIPEAEHPAREFRIDSLDGQTVGRQEVWPAEALEGSLLAPLGVRWLQADCDVITLDSHRILRSDDSTVGQPYTLAVAAGARHPAGAAADDRELLHVPDWAQQNPRIRQLADELFAGCQTRDDRIGAVTRYLQAGEYSLIVPLPARWARRPIEWFLLERPAGNCEYYATSASILLRMGGVPCRYVSGFAVHERNPFSGTWIARNRDAHAWVEALDGDNQWITVEATPGDGIPSSSDADQWDYFREFAYHRFQKLRAGWQRRGWSMVGGLLVSAAQSTPGWIVIGLVCAGTLRRLLKRPRRQPLPYQSCLAIEPRLRDLRRSLARVDRAVGRKWRPRIAHETLHEYVLQLQAAQAASSAVPTDAVAANSVRREARHVPLCRLSAPAVQAVAAWYQAYADARYGTLRSDDSIRQLATAARLLVATIRNSQR